MTPQTRTPSSLALSILETLVANPPIYEEDRGYKAIVCASCGASDATVKGSPDHAANCAFRLAVNFVGTHTPSESRFLVHCRVCAMGVAFANDRDGTYAIGWDHFQRQHDGAVPFFNVLEVL